MNIGNLLRDACILNIPYILEWALQNGGELDKIDSGYLYTAARNGSLEAVKILVKYGAGDSYGRSKKIAAHRGHTEVLDYLNSVKPNIQSQL